MVQVGGLQREFQEHHHRTCCWGFSLMLKHRNVGCRKGKTVSTTHMCMILSSIENHTSTMEIYGKLTTMKMTMIHPRHPLHLELLKRREKPWETPAEWEPQSHLHKFSRYRPVALEHAVVFGVQRQKKGCCPENWFTDSPIMRKDIFFCDVHVWIFPCIATSGSSLHKADLWEIGGAVALKCALNHP